MDGYNPNAATDDYYSYGLPAVSSNATPAGGRNGYPGPFNGVELQPTNTCPRNFIIFDQTEDKSRVMFHPALAQKYSGQHFDVGAVHSQYPGGYHVGNTGNHDKSSSSLKEDLDDIDALLSLEEEEDTEEDDVVSTGRTPGHYQSNSPGSVSSSARGSKSCKMRSPSQSSTSNAVSGRKKGKMKKMVKALKGIVPGGDQMDTPTVLDEAVRYLKSLKVQVEKLGIRDFKN